MSRSNKLLYVISKSNLPIPSEEMILFYNKRTNEHIDRVYDNLIIVPKIFPGISPELRNRGILHDESKFSEDELVPYIHMSWQKANPDYKYPKGVSEAVDIAVGLHLTTNRHHPEGHATPKDMNKIDIIEMLADWNAMSQEFNNSLREWVDKNVGGWDFDKWQLDLIYKLVEFYEDYK